MIAADGKGVAIPTKHENVQVWARERNAAGKRKRTPVDEVRTVRLDKVWEAGRAADARDGRDLFVLHLALFDELVIEREHTEIATAGAPSRVVGSGVLLGERFAFNRERGDAACGGASEWFLGEYGYGHIE